MTPSSRRYIVRHQSQVVDIAGWDSDESELWGQARRDSAVPAHGRSFQRHLPAHRGTHRRGRCRGAADVDSAVSAARAAFDSGPWGHSEPLERIAAMRRLADVYDQRRSEMAEIITAEIGAPITFAQRAQVGLPAMMMRAFCDLAERHQWQETRTGFFGADVHVRKEPSAWSRRSCRGTCRSSSSSPNWCPRCSPAARWCSSPRPNRPLDALLLAEMIDEIDLPPGVVSVLPGDGSVGELLVGHRGVDKVSFTGSTAAGRAVAAACARRPDQGQPRTRRQVRGHRPRRRRARKPSPPECGRPACPTAGRSATR